MEIDLFHLNAYNTPLILFDRVINWVQKHEGTITQNRAQHLIKRGIFLQDLNAKLYAKEILMKPYVDNIFLSSS